MAPLPVALGISIGLVASLVQSIGLTLQRKSHLQNQSQDAADQKSDWNRPLWLLGFMIFVTSNLLGSVFQLGSLPIVILGPLGGVSLIWNALFASMILHDRFSHFLLIGTLLIAGGAVLIAVFGAVPEPVHDLPEILRLYSRPAFLIWLVGLGLIVAVALIWAHISDARLRRESTRDSTFTGLKDSPADFDNEESNITEESLPKTPRLVSKRSSRTVRFERSHLRRWSEPVNLTLDMAAIEDLDAENTNLQSSPHSVGGCVQDQQKASRYFIIGIAFGSVSGIMSGLCLLLAKTGVELLILSIVGTQNEFGHWQSWMIVLVLLAASLMQLWYLNKSLKLLGPTLICPLAFCFYNLSSILNGLFFYDQWKLLTPLKIGLVALGIVVLLAGVWIVSLKSASPIEADDDQPTETSPLLAISEYQELAETFEPDEMQKAEARRRRGMQALKALLLEAPTGLSIGIAASSPGFALRPAARRHDRQHANLRASTISLPPESGSPKTAPASPTFSRHGRSDSEHMYRRNSASPTVARWPTRHIANEPYVGDFTHHTEPSQPTSPDEARRRSNLSWSSLFTSPKQ